MKICPKCKCPCTEKQEYCICGFRFEKKSFDLFEFLKNPFSKYGDVEPLKDIK